MAAPRLKTPALILLLLLSALTGTAFCDDMTTSQTENNDGSTSSYAPMTNTTGTNHSLTNTTQEEESGSGELDDSPEIVHMTDQSEPKNGDQTILIGAAVASVIIGGIIIVGIVVWHRRSKTAGNQELTKEDPHLDGPSLEKVPMPMFEEDVPSVLELEMDELDQWMKKDC